MRIFFRLGMISCDRQTKRAFKPGKQFDERMWTIFFDICFTVAALFIKSFENPFLSGPPWYEIIPDGMN